MTIRISPLTFLSSAAIVLFAAAQAGAAPGDAQMDACIEAFVAERLPKDRAVRVRKIDTTSPLYPQARSQRITLTAKGARSGTQYASATCIVEDDGVSVSLQESAPEELAHTISQ